MEENAIPLNNELLTVARISDMELISTNYSLTDIAAVLIQKDTNGVNSMFERDSVRLLNIIGVLSFFTDTELVTAEFKENANRALDILNLFKNGISLTDSNVATLKATLSFVYTELVEFGKTNIPLHKSITFSLVDKELEDALYKISTYPYAAIARLNSLIYKNVNSLIFASKMMDTIVYNINREISKLDVMIDMCKVSNAHSRSSVVVTANDLYHSNRLIIKRFIDNKFVVGGNNNGGTTDNIKTDITDLELLNTINTYREKIKAIYSTLKLDKISDAFNFNLDDLYNNSDDNIFANAEFKEYLFKVKYDVDILTELICSITDSINDSIEKLKKSIPVSDNEIDNIDAI
jgi:hypothetical protein